jgi:hypothetical protein
LQQISRPDGIGKKTAIGHAFNRSNLTAAMIHPPLQPDHAKGFS